MNVFSGLILAIYLVGVFAIGLKTGKCGSESEEAYFTGNKGFGPWATAISAGATNSSGWIFIGACGWAFQVGLYSMWMMIGFIFGAMIDMFFMAPRLRAQGKKLRALNVSDYLEKRLQTEWGVSKESHSVRVVAACLLVLFFIPYMAAQLTSTGKTIQTIVSIDYNVGLIFGAVFVVGFCYFGGYKSVIYTDLTQGLIMMAVFIFAPIMLIFGLLGGWTSFWQQLIAIDPLLATPAFGTTGIAGAGLIFGWICYGVGQAGQPHIQQRYLTAKDDNTIKSATYIMLAWNIIGMEGSNLLGLIGRVLMPDISDPEFVFPAMVVHYGHPIFVGIVIAAIISAIASTYSSQLMVAVQAISSDLLHSFSKKERTQKELVKISQVTMIVMGIISTGIALLNIDSVFRLVNYAWSATASAFGPMEVYMLAKPKMCNREGAIAGMITGGVVSTAWYAAGLSGIIHEILPGILAALIIIPLVTKATAHKYNKVPGEKAN